MRFMHRTVHLLSLTLALLGGLALVAITLITVFSITGRALVWAGLGPVPGDFELVEAGTGFAVFSFLAWCHLKREHASVEILTMQFSPFVNRVIDVVVDALMLIVATILAYQHWLGTLDKLAYGETSFILRFPVWWAYAAGLVGAVVFVLVAIYCLISSAVAVATWRSADPERPAA
jgi:TRAP-type C4-dicarboxylate transport system permease small subunit